MTRNAKVLILSIAVIIVVSLVTVFLNGQNPFDLSSRNTYKPGYSYELDQAVTQAQALYNQKKSKGFDLSSGPCLTNDLMQGWVADLVHSPRTKEDDKEENQCKAYLEGRATHFVELDLNGEVVRIK